MTIAYLQLFVRHKHLIKKLLLFFYIHFTRKTSGNSLTHIYIPTSCKTEQASPLGDKGAALGFVMLTFPLSF